MSRRQISQNEAHKLAKRVQELERQKEEQTRRWADEWPSYTVIHRIEIDSVTAAIVNTARALSHAVVVTMKEGKLTFWGSKL